MHRCQCVCLCQHSSMIAVVREALAPVYPSGLPSLAFCYVHFCSCASACSELVLVNLCSWLSSVNDRRRDPSLFVVVSVFPGGRRNFCACTPVHMPVSSFIHASRVLPGTCACASVGGLHSRAFS